MKKEKTKIMIGFFKKMRFRSEQPYTLYIVLTHAIMFRGKKKKKLVESDDSVRSLMGCDCCLMLKMTFGTEVCVSFVNSLNFNS